MGEPEFGQVWTWTSKVSGFSYIVMVIGPEFEPPNDRPLAHQVIHLTGNPGMLSEYFFGGVEEWARIDD